MLRQTDTIYATDGMDAITKLDKIDNPTNTFVIMTNSVFQEIVNMASKPPIDSYQTADGKPSANLIREVTVYEIYTIRARQVFLDGRSTCWWIICSLIGNAKERQNFTASEPGRVVIVAKG